MKLEKGLEVSVYYKIAGVVLFLLTGSISVKAQLDPLTAQFFNNQYLANPALAGAEEGLVLNGGFRKLWNKVPGSPLTQSLTADYGFNKVGLGINLGDESSGLLKQTRVVGSYAYHVQLNNAGSSQLHFGVSLGFSSQRLASEDVYGDAGDPEIGMYNLRKTYLDGDFGAAFTSGSLSIQAAIPNLKSFFRKETTRVSDVATFYGAVSYQFVFSAGENGIQLEPKAIFRGVQGHDNIWDAGAQLRMIDRQVLFTAMYHSTESSTFGLGMDFKKKYLISGFYSTETSALSGYTNGSFEISLRVKLGK